MDLLVLGPVEVRNQGVPVSIGGPKQRSILALLVAEAGHPVSVDRIIEDVYGDDAPEGARRSVQTLVSMIRRELGDVVQQAGRWLRARRSRSRRSTPFRFENEVRLGAPGGRDRSGDRRPTLYGTRWPCGGATPMPTPTAAPSSSPR